MNTRDHPSPRRSRIQDVSKKERKNAIKIERGWKCRKSRSYQNEIEKVMQFGKQGIVEQRE